MSVSSSVHQDQDSEGNSVEDMIPDEDNNAEPPQFELTALIGKGTFGEVFSGTWDDEQVAIKRIRSRTNLPESREVRVLCEALEGSVELLCAFTTLDELGQPIHNLVFPLYPGTLTDLLHSFAWCEETVRKLASQLLRGLAALHDAGWIHRDLKPDNLLLDNSDGLRIADLGCAATTDAVHSPLVGTAAYRSPEIFMGSTSYSCSVDIWSAAAILAEISGRKLFPTASSSDGEAKVIMQMLRVIGSAPVGWMARNAHADVRAIVGQRLERPIKPDLKYQEPRCPSLANMIHKMLKWENRIDAKTALQQPFFTSAAAQARRRKR